MKLAKIILIVLIICWMITVFLFSHQKGETSGGTSEVVIKKIMKLFSKEKPTEEQIKKLQLPIRKLAHFTIYAIGGVLAILLLAQYDISFWNKILYSQIFISIYAISDEFHQYFIPRKNCNFKRCINRFSWWIYCDNIDFINIFKKIERREKS